MPATISFVSFPTNKAMSSIFDLSAQTIDGQAFDFQSLRGKALLVVNTASACGFTPQFAGLQALHERFGPDGLVVLGFPCNQFGAQDSGSLEEIAQFCQRNYGVSFQMMEKVDVNGANAHPVFAHLTEKAPGILNSRFIKWNFTKFLVSKDGAQVTRYAPNDEPKALTKDIEAALAG
jgi:glutathione peroxidase